MRNYYSFLCFIALLLSFSSCADSGLNFTVSNKSDFDRLEELVEIPLSKIDKSLVLKSGEVLNIADNEGNILVSQITYDKKIVFQPQLKAGETKTFKFISAPSQNFDLHTSAHYHSEGDKKISWENDKVGFRLDGESSGKIELPTNGVDLWYIKDILKEASYNKSQGENSGVCPMNSTLGATSMSPVIDDVLLMNGNFTSHEILENGPLRSSFKLVYPPIKIKGKDLVETRVISLDAGSQLTKISQEYSTDDQRDHFNLATGFAKRDKEDQLIYEKGKNYMVYQDSVSGDHVQIYLGLVIPQGIEKVDDNSCTYVNPVKQQTENYSNILAYITYMPGAPAVYYTGFGWNKSGFENIEQFERYVSDFSKSLKQPLFVTYSNKQ